MADQHKCREAPRVQAFLEGGLTENQQAALASHLKTCDACRADLDEPADKIDLLSGDAKELVRQQAEPDEALNNMIEQLRAEGPGGGDDADDVTSELTGARHSIIEGLSLDFLAPSDSPEYLGRLGSYEIIEVVGQGGMGIVLKARDLGLSRIVAIKVMSPQMASNATARKRFQREARAAAAVSHDHVVTIHAVDQTDHLPFLVMAYVDGVSLESRIKRGGPLGTEEILRIGTQAASGLAAAHAQGLVHRDIKPANILLENGVERVKITDFGLARAADDAQITQTGVVAGTPQYMSPEQTRGETVDHRSDLFSLGCVLYAMCTGRSPFRATTIVDAIRRVCEDTPRPVREVNSKIPDWLVDIIGRLLAKNPDRRFQSAEAVAKLLGDHLAHLQRPADVPRPLATTTVSSSPARREIRPRYYLKWTAAAVILLMVGGIGYLLATGWNGNRETRVATGAIEGPKGGGDDSVIEPASGSLIVQSGDGPSEDVMEWLGLSGAKDLAEMERLGIYAMNVTTGKAVLVRDEPIGNLTYFGSPSFSSDGRRILFDVSPGKLFRETRMKLFYVARRKAVIKDLGLGNCPTLSPDGEWIAFCLNSGTVPGARRGIWLMRADGSERRCLGGDGVPKWSPDGKQLLIGSFTSPCRLSIMDVETAEERPVLLAGHNFYSTPSWAGDSQTIVAVFSSGSDAGVALVDVTDPEQARVIQILWKKGDAIDVSPFYPVYSPETDLCVFVGRDQNGEALYAVKPGQSDPPKRLEPARYDVILSRLSFSSDGRHVLFCSDRNNQADEWDSTTPPEVTESQ